MSLAKHRGKEVRFGESLVVIQARIGGIVGAARGGGPAFSSNPGTMPVQGPIKERRWSSRDFRPKLLASFRIGGGFSFVW
jgi:hypothetical protein